MKIIANSNPRCAGPVICKGGKCPTLYQDENNDFFIQGYIVKDKDISIPNDECLVKVSKELIINIKDIEI